MSNLFRLLVAAMLVASAILVITVGLMKDTPALLAPVHLILFVAGVAFYLLPTLLAMHRNCNATGWIAALNILLGWTLLGWVIALGWAASGKRTVPPATPPAHPVLGH